ncbi:type IV pili methyl-accepting chemotaxis transducer N-terminal domain-containing protein [Tamlana agarivorans]|uniref:Type IV pili methyl-accepting chemotaxis transducer N-terminal domain-containing protein n=1 Tax=Pseudotamlana agarivorans TaxID=481183 RepID=A0ACC5UA16_9FLAO|nr:type IV pili methyl-accepting chemotaxis transducer N-terminal domain-containing protein [Tamlana agarivorans]MBU2951120.1 type IV pili methyl-accepting chemotaxis transducer N-terminal domain-containing protein [Tamlana agarivorans]
MKTKSHFIVLNIILLLLTVNISFSQSQKYGSISYNKAINISGKQRMLSQKMSKAYLLLANGIYNDKIKKELSSSKFIFERQLMILKDNAETDLIKLRIKNIEGLWEDFKPLITSNPDLKTSKKIMNMNTKLLKSCNDLVLSIESLSSYSNNFFSDNNQELVEIINVSGKQRMLSQRLCLYFTACSLFPKEKDEYEKVLEATYSEFNDKIGYLLINSYNTTETEEEFGYIMGEWESFQVNKKDFLKGEFGLESVFNTTNHLTTSFNKITGIYEKMVKQKV